MKMVNGKIRLENYHFDRLYKSLEILQIPCGISRETFIQQIEELCQMNQCKELGRIRLTVCRKGSNDCEYSIEAFKLDEEANCWNEKGWMIDICPDVRRSRDTFSSIKSCNYLPYIMAGRFAEANQLDEALVLNSFDAVCDASKTNIFLVSRDIFYTPALNQGGIGGVMRRFLIEEIQKRGLEIRETIVTEKMLLEANEVFMTNAILGMRWVKQFRQASYGHQQIKKLYSDINW
jgi:branched-chain amino acid aminotransferase